MNMLIPFCVLLACCLPVNALRFTECQNGQIDIKPGKQASIKCTALDSNKNCTWSITTPATPATPVTGGTERTIGTCEPCLSSPCPACDVADIGYTITRGPAYASTVTFVANETDHHNTTIRCAVPDNTTGATCRINVIEVYRLSGCFVVENAQTKISCSYREPSYDMNWGIRYPNGSSSLVATCPLCVNNTCPDCDVNNTDFRVTRNSNSSVLQMVNGSDVEKNGAQLMCLRSDNDAVNDTCNIRVFYYNIPQCDGGQLDVSEVEPWTTVSCEGLRQAQNMNWTITDLSGNVSQIAFCDTKRNCTSDSSDVIVSRNNTVSQLTFVGHVREKDNLTLTCVNRNNFTMDSCRIRTFYPAETNNVTVGVDSNLTVTGRVYIDKVFASDDNITCQWFHTVDNKTGDELLSSLSLSTFTDTDGLEYQRGHCEMTLPVNSSEITHYFGVWVQPSNDTVQLVGAIIIEKPGPNLTTTCPDYVSEGSDLTCECSHLAAQHGNPPATISWLNVTEAADLHVSNVSRKLNGTDYVCTSVWGAGMPDVQSSVDYTLLVAYGPENVTLNGSAYYITDDLQNVTLTCTWEEVYPSVNVTWSVPCMTLTFSLVDNSTCTLDTTLIRNVSAVTCTAVNTGTPQLHATDVFTFLFEKPGPNLTTTCPDYVSEGSDLTCECSHLTAQHGNPPATISWRDITDTADLHVRNVSRNMNGTEYVCSSIWGEGRPEEVRSSDQYTMLVAYGPNNVTVYASGDGDDDLSNVTLTCVYDVAYPSVNFTWSVACLALTMTSESSTCTIDKGMIDVREVACMAYNTKFPKINANRSYTFLSNEAVTSPFPLVGVVVGVVAALLLFIIIVVVVIIAKRRASRKTHKDGSTSANNDRDVDEEKGSQLSSSKDQVPTSDFKEHINTDNEDAVTSRQVLTVRDDQLQGSSKQGQSTEMAHLNKDAKEATIKDKEAKLKLLEMEKQTARENEERNREEKKKEKAREQEEKKRQQAEEKEAKKKQEAQEKEDKKREKAKGREDKMAEKVREEEEKKKEKEREEEEKKKEKARAEEAQRKEQARKEEEEREKEKKKEKEREEEEKREKEKAKEEEENRKAEEKRKAKVREDEEKEKQAREDEAKNRQRAAEKDAKQKQEALEKEERKAKAIEEEKRTDKEERDKPHVNTDTPEEKEKKPTETPEEREARKQKKLKKLLEKIMQKIMQVFMAKQGLTATDTDTIKTYEKNRERRQKAEAREARRKERLANKKETIEAQEEKEARREARKQQKVQEKEARRKDRLARKENEKTETEEEKEARRQARRVKKEARRAREQEKKAREEERKARKQDRKARDQDEHAKDPALKKDQNQDLTNTAKEVPQADFEEHINELYESADTVDEKAKSVSPRNKVTSEHDDFEEHINDLYESADDLDHPENSSKTKTTRSKSGAAELAPDDEFEEHINDFYQSADDLDVPEKSSTMNSPQSTSTPPDDEFEEHINDMYESADDLDNLGNPTKSRQSQRKVVPLADGKYSVDGSIYHELESEEDTSETVTDTDYESIAYDSDIYDSLGELDSTDDSSSDGYADSLDEEIYDYIDDIYESIDDVFDVNSSDVTSDSKPGAQDGPELPLFLKEKLANPGTDTLLAELKAVLHRAQKEGVAIPRKEPRPNEKEPLPQAEKEDMKSPCTNVGSQGTPAPSLKGVPNRLDINVDGCVSVKAAKAFLDSQVHMYSQDEWAKKKGKPQEKEWHTEKDPTEKPAKETATGTDRPQDKESRTTEKTDKQAMKVPQSIRQKEDTTKGSVLKKTPPTVPQKPKGGNWKLNGQAQPDAPDEVYTDCLSHSQKVDPLTAIVGKPTISMADKEVISQEPNAQHKPRRSELYVSVAPLKQKPKAMTKSAKTGDNNTNSRAAGSNTQEVTKTAEPDDVYSELGSTRRNQEADPIYNHLNQ